MLLGTSEGFGRLLNRFLDPFGLRLMRLSDFERLQSEAAQLRYKKVLDYFPKKKEHLGKLAPYARSQNGQDLVAALSSNFSESGFFVEFGATDGLEASNTYLLEKKLKWTGILAEPAREWHGRLRRNRRCVIDKRAVWKSTGQTLDFVESGQFSTLVGYADQRTYGSASRKYQVQTISLADLLAEHGAPKYIDFLSVDTEGSELEVLQDFPFQRYSFGYISVEHNGKDSRAEIVKLLESNGYVQILSKESLFDAWFVSKSVYESVFC